MTDPGPSTDEPSGRRASRLEAELAKLRQPAPAAPSRSTRATVLAALSRARGLVAAGLSDLRERADDPSRAIRALIRDMEDTLVAIRASAARTIADQKEMQRHARRLIQLQADWGDKAQLALSKGREDLARAALVEKGRAAALAAELNGEIAELDGVLRAYEDDIEALQSRLRDARSRHAAITARLESAENRIRLRTVLTGERVDVAMARFEELEQEVDAAEGRADALALRSAGREPDLAGCIAALADDPVEAELAAMKRGIDRPRADESA